VALSDLGGLGVQEGSPVVYNWTRPNPLPVVLPWLAVLLLLLLKSNRCPQAWWIWVPLGTVAGLGAVLRSELEFIPSVLQEVGGGSVGAMGFGLAAVWLIAAHLGWKHRVLAWAGTLVALGAFSFLTFGLAQTTDGFGPETMPELVLLAVGTVVLSLAVTVAGLVCRGRYSPLRLCLWLLALLLGVWLLVVGPFFIVAMVFSPASPPIGALFGIVASLACLSLGLLLPFLILSFANAFYRARLKDLLHLGREAAPPVIERPVPAAAAAAGS
jgi:hypothetical protein